MGTASRRASSRARSTDTPPSGSFWASTELPKLIAARSVPVGAMSRTVSVGTTSGVTQPASNASAARRARVMGSALLRLAFRRAGILARAAIADHADRLDLDLDPRPHEVGDRDERAAGIVAVLEHVFAHLDEAVAVARLLDEHRHGDDVGEAAAGALQDRVDLREHLFHLRLEVVRDIGAGIVARRGLARDPDDLAALGDHAGREGARELERRLLHVLGRVAGDGQCEQDGSDRLGHGCVLFIGVGMQPDAIAFAVEHDGAEAVRPYAFYRLQDAATKLFYLAHGVADAAVDVHVDEDADRAHFLAVRDQAAAVDIGAVLEHRELEVVELLLRHLDAEHRSVEPARALEVGHRQIEPYNAIGAGVHIAHLAASFVQWNL